MSIEVLAPGTQSTLQDRGRAGCRALGVACAGAADRLSHDLANRIVGNEPDAATVEMSWSGPRLHFSRPAVIALCGSGVDARAFDAKVPMWRPVALPAGTELSLGAVRGGARAYLAVAGGIVLASRLGSRSTDVAGGIGPLPGLQLRKGDRLPMGHPSSDRIGSMLAAATRGSARDASWWIAAPDHLGGGRSVNLRVLPGSHAIVEGRSTLDALVAATWEVGTEATRMGVRLEGQPLTPVATDLVSEPVTIGTVQLPPSGLPIVLGVEAQTIGGYPRIAHVIAADWPRIGQLRPGAQVQFEIVDPATAEAAQRRIARDLARLDEALRACR